MRTNYYPVALVLMFLFTSCKKNDTNQQVLDSEKVSMKKSMDTILGVYGDKIIADLQGEWKEPAYPFDRMVFKNSTVKVFEEGIEEEPRFKKFQLADSCFVGKPSKFIVKNADMHLVIENGQCEKLKISQDTLVLSGFNKGSQRAYQRVYKRIK